MDANVFVKKTFENTLKRGVMSVFIFSSLSAVFLFLGKFHLPLKIG